MALGVIDRPTADIDTYSTSYDPAVYAAVERVVLAVCRDKGWNASVFKELDWFRGIVIAGGGEEVQLDLGVMPRVAATVDVDGIGPVMSLADLRFWKLGALIDRRATRDYLDIDAIIVKAVWQVAEIIETVREHWPEDEHTGVVDAFYRAATLRPADVAGYVIDEHELLDIQVRYIGYAETIASDLIEPDEAEALRTKCRDLAPGLWDQIGKKALQPNPVFDLAELTQTAQELRDQVGSLRHPVQQIHHAEEAVDTPHPRIGR
jgi:hypothetical protein